MKSTIINGKTLPVMTLGTVQLGMDYGIANQGGQPDMEKTAKYYIEETRTLYKAVAHECGFDFNLEYYNEDGGAEFKFIKR